NTKAHLLLGLDDTPTVAAETRIQEVRLRVWDVDAPVAHARAAANSDGIADETPRSLTRLEATQLEIEVDVLTTSGRFQPGVRQSLLELRISSTAVTSAVVDVAHLRARQHGIRLRQLSKAF